MIELAPRHKQGLVVSSPILIGPEGAGAGDTLPAGIEPATFGAIVAGPITYRSRVGSPPPRSGRTVGGIVLHTGEQNRGARSVARKLGRFWERLGCPVVAQLADDNPEALARSVSALNRINNLVGYEIKVPAENSQADMERSIRAVQRDSELPIWLRLSRIDPERDAMAACDAGADALVVGGLPRGAAKSTGEGIDSQAWVRGRHFGPFAFTQNLDMLLQIRALSLSLPIIFSGGVHTLSEVEDALDAGATAVQLDSLLWVEPFVAQRLAEEAGDLGNHL